MPAKRKSAIRRQSGVKSQQTKKRSEQSDLVSTEQSTLGDTITVSHRSDSGDDDDDQMDVDSTAQESVQEPSTPGPLRRSTRSSAGYQRSHSISGHRKSTKQVVEQPKQVENDVEKSPTGSMPSTSRKQSAPDPEVESAQAFPPPEGLRRSTRASGRPQATPLRQKKPGHITATAKTSSQLDGQSNAEVIPTNKDHQVSQENNQSKQPMSAESSGVVPEASRSQSHSRPAISLPVSIQPATSTSASNPAGNVLHTAPNGSEALLPVRGPFISPTQYRSPYGYPQLQPQSFAARPIAPSFSQPSLPQSLLEGPPFHVTMYHGPMNQTPVHLAPQQFQYQGMPPPQHPQVPPPDYNQQAGQHVLPHQAMSQPLMGTVMISNMPQISPTFAPSPQPLQPSLQQQFQQPMSIQFQPPQLNTQPPVPSPGTGEALLHPNRYQPFWPLSLNHKKFNRPPGTLEQHHNEHLKRQEFEDLAASFANRSVSAMERAQVLQLARSAGGIVESVHAADDYWHGDVVHNSVAWPEHSMLPETANQRATPASQIQPPGSGTRGALQGKGNALAADAETPKKSPAKGKKRKKGKKKKEPEETVPSGLQFTEEEMGGLPPFEWKVMADTFQLVPKS